MGQAKRKPTKRLKDILIDGDLDGDFAGRAITVLAGASVHGNLGGRKVIVHGTVHGNIAAPSVELGETAVVEGVLRYGSLTVAPGARVEARCIPA